MEFTITFRKRLWTGAREGIVLQLLLLSLTRTEEELMPVEVTVRTELVGLMARILATVFREFPVSVHDIARSTLLT